MSNSALLKLKRIELLRKLNDTITHLTNLNEMYSEKINKDKKLCA